MGEVVIYGHSDDCIEVDGDICEEFDAYDSGDSKPRFLAFSDGTVLGVRYGDDGIWRINRVVIGSASYAKTEGTDDEDNYTDRVTLTGDLQWAVCGYEFARAPKAPTP